MVDEVETPLEGEPPVFGEVQNHGTVVDAEADVFDRLIALLSERF